MQRGVTFLYLCSYFLTIFCLNFETNISGQSIWTNKTENLEGFENILNFKKTFTILCILIRMHRFNFQKITKYISIFLFSEPKFFKNYICLAENRHNFLPAMTTNTNALILIRKTLPYCRNHERCFSGFHNNCQNKCVSKLKFR